MLGRDQVPQEGERVGRLVIVPQPARRRDEFLREGALHLGRARLHRRPHGLVADDGRRLRRERAGDVEIDRRGAVVADVRLGLAVVADRLQPVAEGEAAPAPVGRRPHDRPVADRPDEVHPADHRRQRLGQHLAVAVVLPEHPGDDGDRVAPAGRAGEVAACPRMQPGRIGREVRDRAVRPLVGHHLAQILAQEGVAVVQVAGGRRRTPGRRRSSPAARRAAGSRSGSR